MELVEFAKAVGLAKKCKVCKNKCDASGSCMTCGHDNGGK